MALLGLDTPKKIAVFFGYIALWCWIRAYIYYSTHADDFPVYDRSAAVMLVGICKFVLAAGFFLSADGGFADFVNGWRNNIPLFGKYFVLAVLYAAFDNLTFATLALLSPYSYQVVMQLRLVVTALLWQLLFRKKLSMRQWMSVAMISLAVAVFNTTESRAADDAPAAEDADAPEAVAKRTLGVFLAFLQILCAVCAGIACEYLLKNKGSSGVPLNLQNCFMYVMRHCNQHL